MAPRQTSRKHTHVRIIRNIWHGYRRQLLALSVAADKRKMLSTTRLRAADVIGARRGARDRLQVCFFRSATFARRSQQPKSRRRRLGLSLSRARSAAGVRCNTSGGDMWFKLAGTTVAHHPNSAAAAPVHGIPGGRGRAGGVTGRPSADGEHVRGM